MFEYKAAAWFAKDILTGRDTTLGGRVAAITLQPFEIDGFDDFRIELEISPGNVITVEVQARHRQRLTARDEKFRRLLLAARNEIQKDPNGFHCHHRRLLLVVGKNSPGHDSLHRLCAVASGSHDIHAFVDAISHSPAAIQTRFGYVRDALEGTTPQEVHSVLSVLDVLALDLEGPDSHCIVQSGNELAELWVPPDINNGRATFLRLFWELAERGPRGETVDEEELRKVFDRDLPSSRLAPSRRGLLHGLRKASRGRVTGRLVALGVPSATAELLADHALSLDPNSVSDPAYVVTGAVGVGKSTELERLFRRSAAQALDKSTAPLPVYIEAAELLTHNLRDLLSSRTSSLGRPEAQGVFAVIDGLDEVGMTVESLAPAIFAVLGEWPHSTFVLGDRDPGISHALPVYDAEPLSDQSYLKVREIMRANTQLAPATRREVTELLRRPLFAILHGMRLANNRPGSTSPATLIGSLAEHAVLPLARSRPEMIEALASLAAQLVDAGGVADLGRVGLSQIDMEPLRRSRLLHVSDGQVRFQLAVLNEWFAARHLLHSDVFAESVIRDPQRADRWRYVLAQAVAQASEGQAEDLLEAIATQGSGALVAWILSETVTAFPGNEPRGLPTSSNAAERTRRAMAALASATWPMSKTLRGISPLGKPEVGVRVSEASMEFAVPSPNDFSSQMARRTLFPPEPGTEFEPSDPATTWLPYRGGLRPTGPAWAWAWPAEECSGHLDSLMSSGLLAASIDEFTPELAWRFAYAMLGREATVLREPVPVEALVGALDEFGANDPSVNGGTGFGQKTWTFDAGRRFIRDLVEHGIREVSSPWPPADEMSSWIWGFWTPSQLLARLNAVGPAILNGYRALVDSWLPGFASFLPLYQMMPATIRGFVWIPDRSGSFENQPSFAWYVEPSEESENSARWKRVDHKEDISDQINGVVERFRNPATDGKRPRSGLTIYQDASDAYTATPAYLMARSLLHAELRSLKWTKALLPASTDVPLTLPIIRHAF